MTPDAPRPRQRLGGIHQRRDTLTIADIVAGVQISGVARGLGLPVRHGRTIATWRRGTHYSVGLYDHTGGWRDYVTDDRGGVIALICRVRGYSRRDAADWLAGYAGVALDAGMDRAEYARRRAAADAEARELVSWRDDMLDVLMDARDAYFHAYHRARRYLRDHGADAPQGTIAMDVYDLYESRYQQYDAMIDRLRGALWADLRQVRRGMQERAI